MRVKDAVGRYGEQVAADHLVGAGLQVLARNWRCRAGELDIVALDGDELVFVEVKTRSSALFGSPAEAVDSAKAARIRLLAARWLSADRAEASGRSWCGVRFDVVAVTRARSGVEVQHFRGAF